MFGDIPLLGVIQQKMSWLNDRQSVLSRNIANSSTPGYVPQDLRANDFAAALSGVTGGSLNVTNPLHMRGGSSSAVGSFRPYDTPDSTSSPDGNSVVLEQQMMKIAETQISYSEASGLYKKMTAMWRTALGGAHG
jgi:flagellar basal-body rod protein FlgB